MHIRGVVYGAILLITAAGCANSPTGPVPEQPAPPGWTAPPSWTAPAAYKFSFESACGEQALIGRFRAEVAGGTVVATEGLDEAGKRALMLRIANLIPTLEQMVADAKQAEADGADQVVIDRDPVDGHPTFIKIDVDDNATDDETCYKIWDYTIGGTPGPNGSPSG